MDCKAEEIHFLDELLGNRAYLVWVCGVFLVRLTDALMQTITVLLTNGCGFFVSFEMVSISPPRAVPCWLT